MVLGAEMRGATYHFEMIWNKGGEAAMAALETVDVLHRVRSDAPR